MGWPHPSWDGLTHHGMAPPIMGWPHHPSWDGPTHHGMAPSIMGWPHHPSWDCPTIVSIIYGSTHHERALGSSILRVNSFKDPHFMTAMFHHCLPFFCGSPSRELSWLSFYYLQAQDRSLTRASLHVTFASTQQHNHKRAVGR